MVGFLTIPRHCTTVTCINFNGDLPAKLIFDAWHSLFLSATAANVQETPQLPRLPKMGDHFPEASGLLGAGTVGEIIDYVRGGKLSDQHVTDFVQQLMFTSRPNVLYGNHKRRMDAHTRPEGDVEVRQVLSDWWNEELHSMTKAQALHRLANVFYKIEVYPLAKALQDTADGRGKIVLLQPDSILRRKQNGGIGPQ